MEIAFMEQFVSLDDGNTVAMIALKYLIKPEFFTRGMGYSCWPISGLEGPGSSTIVPWRGIMTTLSGAPALRNDHRMEGWVR